MAREGLASGDAVGWFEALYTRAGAEGGQVPWDDGAPYPELRARVEQEPELWRGARTLVVGCGFGHDAALLERHGARATAFDVSPTVVEAARRRFGDGIEWCVADLRRAPAAWSGAFDRVVEINTLQVLLGDARRSALEVLPGLLAPGGELLLACRLREAHEPEGEMPWPLTLAELARLEGAGLERLEATVALDSEDPPVRRLTARWKRPAS